MLYFGFNQQILNKKCEIIYSTQYHPKERYCLSSRADVFRHLFHRYIGYSAEDIIKWGNNNTPLITMLEWGACWRVAYRRKLLIEKKIRFNSNIKLNEDSMFNALAVVYATKTASIDKCIYNYYLRTNGALNSQLSSQIIRNKEELFKERERIIALAQAEGFNVDESSYAGSIVMGIIEIFIKSNFSDWKKIRKLMSSDTTRKCIRIVAFTRNKKFCICALFLKTKLSYVLFILLQIAKKLGIKLAL